MRIVIAAVLMLASLPLAAAVPAEEQTVTWYDVEIIVFRNLDTRSTETWPPDAGVPAVEKARALFPASESETTASDVKTRALSEATSTVPVPYEPLAESAFQLTGVAGSLRRSSRYDPILHAAWTQPPLERNQAPYIRLTLPGAFDTAEAREIENGEAAFASEPSTATDAAAPEFLREENDLDLARPLDGIVQLSVSRYLHLDLDLLYLPDNFNTNVLGEVPAATREWTEEEKRAREERHRDILDALARGDITLEEAEILALEPEQQVFQGFRLNQYRRMRSRELHYFDHPVFGAIVMVTPREVPVRMLEAGGAPAQ